MDSIHNSELKENPQNPLEENKIDGVKDITLLSFSNCEDFGVLTQRGTATDDLWKKLVTAVAQLHGRLNRLFVPTYKAETADEFWAKVESKQENLSVEELEMVLPLIIPRYSKIKSDKEKETTRQALFNYLAMANDIAKSKGEETPLARDAFLLMYVLMVVDKIKREEDTFTSSFAQSMAPTGYGSKSLTKIFLYNLSALTGKPEIESMDFRKCKGYIYDIENRTQREITEGFYNALDLWSCTRSYREIVSFESADPSLELNESIEEYSRKFQIKAMLLEQQKNGLTVPKSVDLSFLQIPMDPVTRTIFMGNSSPSGVLNSGKIKATNKKKLRKNKNGKSKGEISYKVEYPQEFIGNIEDLEVVDFYGLANSYPELKKILSHLNPWDRKVFIASSNICQYLEDQNRPLICSIVDIYHNMGYKKGRNPNSEMLEKILVSLKKMKILPLMLDNRTESGTGFNYEQYAEVTFQILDWDRIHLFYQNGTDAGDYISFMRVPPLFKFAKNRGQMLNVPMEVLQKGPSKTEMNLSIESFLQWFISIAKGNAKKNIYATQILNIKTMLDICNIPTRYIERASKALWAYMGIYEDAGIIINITKNNTETEFSFRLPKGTTENDNKTLSEVKTLAEKTNETLNRIETSLKARVPNADTGANNGENLKSLSIKERKTVLKATPTTELNEELDERTTKAMKQREVERRGFNYKK